MAHVPRASSDNIIALCWDIEMCGCYGPYLVLKHRELQLFL